VNALAAKPLPGEPVRVALVGAPNSGKTTLFNAFTGARAQVGNFAGVTVTRREGRIESEGREVRLLDLPGTYSLEPESAAEAIVHDLLAGTFPGEDRPDALLLVVDATTLPRSLGLVAQALQLDIPILLVLTMIDEVQARGMHLDVMKLSRMLGIPVLGVVGHRGVGVQQLRQALAHPERWWRPREIPPADDPVERFAWVDRVVAAVTSRREGLDARTERVDRVLLHPVGGLAVFAVTMVALFQSIFTLAVPLMDAIDGLFGLLGRFSARVLPPGLLTDFWIDGVLTGLGAVLVFLPQIVILFALIHFLEDVGYLARAAFVVDRVMGWAGLQGRSFVPLLSCFACAVPGILSARTIPSPRDRLSTILVAPFMPCSARLPVYTLLIAAFIPAVSVGGVLSLQALVMLGLYVLGSFTALASAALLNRTMLRGTPARFYMELPPYRMPTIKLLAAQVWSSARAFLERAGTIILAVALIFWVLLTFPRMEAVPGLDATQQTQAQLEQSVAGTMGQTLEPVIEPLGFDWRIGVGLVASFAAREVIIATLAQTYAVGDGDFDGLRAALRRDSVFSVATALSLLVFFVFALQCTSTIAVMGRETGSWQWPTLAFFYMLALAYAGSFVTYQLARMLV
jgi:ferrous iron transport protein B